MQTVCPITDKRINERVARLNALATVVLVVLFVIVNFWGGMLLMVIDFAIRGFVDSKYSPICQMNKWIALRLDLSPKMMNAGPKIFAAQVGLILSGIALVAALTGFSELSLVVAGILGLFSFLEAAFGFCVACKLYPLIRKK